MNKNFYKAILIIMMIVCAASNFAFAQPSFHMQNLGINYWGSLDYTLIFPPQCIGIGNFATPTAPVTGQYMCVPVIPAVYLPFPFIQPSPICSFNTGLYTALSGRDAPMIFYSWGDGSSGFDGSKDVPWINPTLKIENEIQNQGFITGIFPNPNNGNFTINLNTEIGESFIIEIYNSIGQKIYSYTNIAQSTKYSKEISLDNFNDGIYFVREIGSMTNNSWKLVVSK